MKFYEVFKAGTYPQGKFSKKEIEQIAKNYDPKFCEAPITLDHHQSGPAYGWVDTVKAENDKLKVSFKDIPEEFEKAVNSGKELDGYVITRTDLEFCCKNILSVIAKLV